ncbi:MAG: shikimate kinase [Alphaproteobacteria bacterium]
MKKYNRICVIGNSGAGKSTFSRKLAEKLNYPLCHIDKIIWKAGWKEVSDEERLEKIQEFIAQDKWIFDGNAKSTYGIRLAKADLVIFLDLNPLLCCYRVILRMLMNEKREDMAFYRYILTYRKKIVPLFYQAYEKYKNSVDLIVVKTPQEIEKLLAEF